MSEISYLIALFNKLKNGLSFIMSIDNLVYSFNTFFISLI